MELKNCLTALAVIVLALQTASAISIGAGPSTIDFGKMVKGGYAEKTITVSTSGSEDLTCTVDYTGDLKDWLSTDQNNPFTLPSNGRLDLKAIIQPPSDAPNGKYAGAIYIKAAPTSSITSGAGLAVGAGVKIKITAEITGLEDMSLAIKGLKASDTEADFPIKFEATVLNTGNIRAKPNFTVDILDASGKKLSSGEYSDTTVIPTKVEDIAFTLESTGLASGPYTANVNVYEKDELVHTQTVSFKILPKGSWTLSGKLQSLNVAPQTVNTGEIVKVTAEFKNTGQGTSKARLKAESYINERLTDVIRDSDELDVEPGRTITIETYYTPSKPGSYIIRGYVIYGASKTDVKGAILKVEGANAGTDYMLYAVAVIILLLLVIAFILFQKNRRSQYPENSPPSFRESQRGNFAPRQGFNQAPQEGQNEPYRTYPKPDYADDETPPNP